MVSLQLNLSLPLRPSTSLSCSVRSDGADADSSCCNWSAMTTPCISAGGNGCSSTTPITTRSSSSTSVDRRVGVAVRALSSHGEHSSAASALRLQASDARGARPAEAAEAAEASSTALRAPTTNRNDGLFFSPADADPHIICSHSEARPQEAHHLRRRPLLLTPLLLPFASAAASLPLAFSDPASASESASATCLRPLSAPAREVVPAGSTVRLSISDGCTLGVSAYPDFVYNVKKAGGGGGIAIVRYDNKLDSEGSDVGGDGEGGLSGEEKGVLRVAFDPSTLNIPPVQSNSATFLGLPLPPPLNIAIVPQELAGTIDLRDGQLNLKFRALFNFTAGPLYKAPSLIVDALLTTEEAVGPTSGRRVKGQRLNSEGSCRLVAVTQVVPVNDAFLDNFLLLPADVVAVLPAQLCWDSS